MSMPDICAIVENQERPILGNKKKNIVVKENMKRLRVSVVNPVAGLALVGEFEDGTVVAERASGAEGAHGGEDVAKRRLAGGGFLQALIAEEFPRRIFRLGDAVGNEHETVASLQMPVPARVVHIRQQAHGHVCLEQARYCP